MEAARPFLHVFFLGGLVLWAALTHAAIVWIRLALKPRTTEAPAPARSVAMPSVIYGAAVFGFATIPWWIPVRHPDPRPELPAGRGRDVFVREACWKCHGPAGPGPDLLREGGPTSAGWTRVMLTEPRWARGDSVMPSFARLTAEDREALVDYVGALRDRRPFRETAVEVAARPGPDPTRGGALYTQHCASCHGAEGRGDGPAAALLTDEAAPRDFTRARFRRRSTPTLPTDEDLFISITAGMPGSAMPPHGHLKPDDRWLLVDKVKSFAWAGAAGSAGFNPFDRWPRKPLAIPEPPAASRERLERGRALVESADCRRCHGDDYRGLKNEDRGFAWIDEAGRPLPRSADLTRGIFKSGGAAKDLYRSIFMGRGGSPMPEYGSLFAAEEDRWAVVEFVRSLKGD
jgi:cytochrome c oxidase cbb3-type subunit 2